MPDHSSSVWNSAVAANAVEILDLQLDRSEQGEWIVQTRVLNRGAGHCIPTGKFGHNEVRILVEIRDDREQIVAQAEQAFLARSEDALPPGKPVDFQFAVGRGERVGDRFAST